MAEFSPTFRMGITHVHQDALLGARDLMQMMADNDPEHMSVALGTLEGAANRLESAARKLRDLIAITRHAKQPT